MHLSTSETLAGTPGKLISDNLKNLKNGTITIEIPAGVGRVIHPDGTTSTATHAVTVPSGSDVKTAYPVQ